MARIGRMTNSITAIKPERLAQYAKDFNADRANLVAANAAVSSGVLEAATDYKGQRALPRDFSIELKQGSITCLLYTSPSPRDGLLSRMPSSA